jgi:hypothetical protein
VHNPTPVVSFETSTTKRGIKNALQLLFSEGLSAEKFYLLPLARMLLEDQNEEACLIALEQELGLEGFSSRCTVCDQKIGATPRFLCRKCWDVDLCRWRIIRHPDAKVQILPAMSDDGVEYKYPFGSRHIPWCRGHEFTEVPRRVRLSLPEGVVNEQRQKFEDWLKELAASYGVVFVD